MNKKITLRKALKSDIPKLVKLDQELVDYHKSIDPLNKTGRQARAFILKEYKKNISKRDFGFFLVEKNEEPIGFLYCLIKSGSPFSTIKKMGSIEAVYVKEEFRKNAIGKLMTEAALTWFKSRKINFITGAVNASNEVAKNFWLKMGASLQGYYFKKFIS